MVTIVAVPGVTTVRLICTVGGGCARATCAVKDIIRATAAASTAPRTHRMVRS